MSNHTANNNWNSVICLCFAVFIVNTSEFLPIGLLPDIALSFNKTNSQAGYLVNNYAWTVVILSLPLTILTAKFERRGLLISLFALFIFFHLITIMAWNFEILRLARIGTACTHAIFFSITPPLAFRLAPVGKQNLAISIMVASTSLATIIGVPLGTIIAELSNWRFAFGCITACALILIIWMGLSLPRINNTQIGSLQSLTTIIKHQGLINIYLLLALVITGYFTFYTYIKPFMQQVAQLESFHIMGLLSFVGCCGIGGSIAFAKLYHKSPQYCTILALMTVLISLALIQPSANSIICCYLLSGLISAALSMLVSIFQTRLIEFAKDSVDVANSMLSAIFNVGIGTGALIGGQIIAFYSVGYVSWVGAAFTASALLIYLTFAAKHIHKV